MRTTQQFHTTQKKELELYVTTELRKRKKTTPISHVFEILAFEQFLDAAPSGCFWHLP